MYARTRCSASSSVVPFGSSSSSPDAVCIARTTSGIVSRARSGGRMTMSTPSPSTFSSESVTRAATSMSASSDSERPVISQSIHTMRSFMCLTLRCVTPGVTGW